MASVFLLSSSPDLALGVLKPVEILIKCKILPLLYFAHLSSTRGGKKFFFFFIFTVFFFFTLKS